MNEYTKRSRQQALRGVLARQPIAGQVELLAALKKRGIRTTQATISRDIRELGVVKVPVAPGAYAYRAEMTEAAPSGGRRLDAVFRTNVTGVKGTAHLVVVKTTPGNANGVAVQIDALKKPAILGTVAGDDTILVVVDTEAHRAALEREFRALLGA
ncbi:MAG: arginine repressor [Candidatus Aminicenantales bacterium]|jgi:transcriptional regulator of arginine metabolism